MLLLRVFFRPSLFSSRQYVRLLAGVMSTPRLRERSGFFPGVGIAYSLKVSVGPLDGSVVLAVV